VGERNSEEESKCEGAGLGIWGGEFQVVSVDVRVWSFCSCPRFRTITHSEISAGGVGLVFLADIAPTFLVKLTAPYWYVLTGHDYGKKKIFHIHVLFLLPSLPPFLLRFHYFAYSIRASICGVLMAASLITVATGETLAVQLIGKGGREGGSEDGGAGRGREGSKRRGPLIGDDKKKTRRRRSLERLKRLCFTVSHHPSIPSFFPPSLPSSLPPFLPPSPQAWGSAPSKLASEKPQCWV